MLTYGYYSQQLQSIMKNMLNVRTNGSDAKNII
jgi:hypothetical protein